MPATIIQTISVIGFILSAYALYIEHKKSKNPQYKAVCDISDKISCSKAFTSRYRKILGVSNSVLGLFFYALIFSLAIFNQINLIFYLAILSVIGTFYLAYVLYFKVRSFCLVCTGIYVVNLLLLVFRSGVTC